MALPRILQDKLALPVIASPLFIISNPDLVIAQCKGGIVGAFPALNARPKELLDAWLTRIDAELAAHRAAHPGVHGNYLSSRASWPPGSTRTTCRRRTRAP